MGPEANVALAVTWTPSQTGHDTSIVHTYTSDGTEERATLIGYALPSLLVKPDQVESLPVRLVSGTRSVSFEIPGSFHWPVHLTLFDPLGIERTSIDLQSSFASLPATLGSGVYFYRLSTAGFSRTGKFVLE